jgi:hypothetical protein
MTPLNWRWPKLTAGLALIVVGALGPPARAGSLLASDFAFPVWQGASTSQPARGHQLDCSRTNVYFPYACELTVHALTSGKNCIAEAITTPLSGVSGTNGFRDTSCIARIEGAVYMTETAAGCVFGGASVQASWQSGVNSTLFRYDGATVTTLLTGAPGFSTWVLKLSSATGPSLGQSSIFEMNERFVVQFNRVLDSCPGEELPNLKANVYDAAADTDLNGRNGYIRQTLVSPI